MSPTMNGVKKARRKFQPQLEAVESAMAFDRYREGYISAQIVQIIGPHVVAYPKMNRQAKTIIAVPAAGVFCGVWRSREKWPTEAKIMKL